MKVQISDYELNQYLSQVCPCFEWATKWRKMNDIGNVEVYLGDSSYVIAIIHLRPKDVPDIDKLADAYRRVKEKVMKYLQDEGFIGTEYIYLALQELDLQNPPDGLLS
jgi:hypothetical protein